MNLVQQESLRFLPRCISLEVRVDILWIGFINYCEDPQIASRIFAKS